MPFGSKNPQEVWDVLCASRIGVFGQPQSIRIGEGGEGKYDVWAVLRPGRRIKLQSQGVGARTWILERLYGLTRGIYNRLFADVRFSAREIAAEV